MTKRATERRFWRLLMADRALWRRVPSQSPRFAKRAAAVDALYSELPAEPREPAPLPSFQASELDRQGFWEATNGFRRSIVVRGLALDSNAVKSWSESHLRERLSGHPCTVLAWDEEVQGRDWDIGAKTLDLDFAELFDRYQDEALYLNNSTDVIEADPSLSDDLGLEAVRRLTTGSTWDELVLMNLFIGSGRVFSELHSAPGGNFFLQIQGRKRWTLLDPKWSAWLHPVTKPPWQSFRSAFGGWRAHADEPGHPLHRLPRFEATLEPGDLLYNAAWWWHEVENLEAFQVGCALRHEPPPGWGSPSMSNQPWLTLASFYPAARSLALAHWALSRATGRDAALRDWIQPLHTGVLRWGLKRAKPGG